MSSTSASTSEARASASGAQAALPRRAAILSSDAGVIAPRCVIRRGPIGRAVGLLGRASLSDGEAMLIARCRAIHTLGMRFAIDAVFVDRRLEVVETISNLAPWRSPPRVGAARHVIEMPAGSIDRWGIAIGDRLVLEPGGG